MVKRRKQVEDSDSEEDPVQTLTPANKRARTTESDDVDPDIDAVMRAIYEGQEGEEGTGDKKAGSIAQAGVISKLELVNFMCHPHLTIEFGPQVNFIVGRNGSGKSAVLSGLQIALGARTYLTGRGSKASELIKYHAPFAEAKVTIRNKGSEAFRPDLFGSKIVIKRKIMRSGTATWAMMNGEGKTISQSKALLQEMSDHMNIQIDSPLNVLTQDAAKQFLANSTPQMKYQFFLEGTQLQQLTEEYELVKQNIRKIDASIHLKQELLPGLQQAAREAKAKYSEATKAREQASKIDQLKKELAWAHVGAKEQQLRAERKEAEQMEKKITKANEVVADLEAKATTVDGEIATLEAELAADANNEEPIKKEIAELEAAIKKGNARIAEIDVDKETAENAFETTTEIIKKLTARLNAEEKKLAAQGQVNRAQILEELEGVRQTVISKEAELEAKNNDIDGMRKDLQGWGQEERGADADRRRTLQDLQANDDFQKQLRDGQKSKYSDYGNNIEAVLREIDNARWRGPAKPIGPLGLYMRLKDDTYREVIQLLIGYTMQQFAVSHADDRLQLGRILQRFGNPHTSIIIAPPDLFDYSSGVPQDPSTLTPLQVIEFSDEWVKRIFINAHSIERNGLAKERDEAQRYADRDRGRFYYTASCHRVVSYREGGGQSQAMERPRATDRDPRYRMFRSSGESDNRLKNAMDEAVTLKNKLDTVQGFQAQIKAKIDNARQTLSRLETSRGPLQSEIAALRRKRDHMEEQAKEEAPIEIQSLQEQKAESEREKESLAKQFGLIMESRDAAVAANRPNIEKYHVLKQRSANLMEDRRKKNKEISDLADKSTKHKRDANHYRDQVKGYQTALDGINENLEVTEAEFTAWSEKALQITDGVIVDDPRDAGTVKREIDALTKALKQRERRHGASVEEMEAEVLRTEKALAESQEKMDMLTGLNAKLKESLTRRMMRWHDFRTAIALRAKELFQYHLGIRGFEGTIFFNHINSTLDIKLRTQVNKGEDGGDEEKRIMKDRDTKSLSGGEKSYSQLCLLLALWDSIGCPIRCLDEYDVFMDSVNRGVATEVLMKTAKSANNKQHIFISPLDITTQVTPGGPVKIIRMHPPDRGQGTID